MALRCTLIKRFVNCCVGSSAHAEPGSVWAVVKAAKKKKKASHLNIKYSVCHMSISRARVGNTRFLLWVLFWNTEQKKKEKKKQFLQNNNQHLKRSSVFKSRHLSFACSYLCRSGSLWAISAPSVPMLYQTCSINLTGHLICSSQSTCSALDKNTLFVSTCRHIPVLYRLPGIQFVPQKMSRAILNLISGWDGTPCLLNEDLWLPCNRCEIHPCLSEFLRGGRGFKGSR